MKKYLGAHLLPGDLLHLVHHHADRAKRGIGHAVPPQHLRRHTATAPLVSSVGWRAASNRGPMQHCRPAPGQALPLPLPVCHPKLLAAPLPTCCSTLREETLMPTSLAVSPTRWKKVVMAASSSTSASTPVPSPPASRPRLSALVSLNIQHTPALTSESPLQGRQPRPCPQPLTLHRSPTASQPPAPTPSPATPMMSMFHW